jgi:hypothetical protein
VLGVHDDPKAPPPPAHFLQDEGPISLDDVENDRQGASRPATGTRSADELAAAARERSGSSRASR